MCQMCKKWFSVDHRRKESVLEEHFDGKAMRKIARRSGTSKSTVLRKYQKEIRALPHNNAITKQFCNRFCGIIVVDGKFVKVRGYERKIPLLWGLDYLSHDIPVYEFAPSESYASWLKYFGYLKSINYPLQIVICDDNINIQDAAKYIFPNVIIQICQNHFLENIRSDLQVRTNDRYKGFVDDLKEQLFSQKYTRKDFLLRGRKLVIKYADNPVALSCLVRIERASRELTGTSFVKGAPRTTNIIESYNSHLEGRLKTIKGFDSFASADMWLNAYILHRRYRPFTDCCSKFRYLNGKTSISQTQKKEATLPLLTI